MRPPKTSYTHPLLIDTVTAPGGGLIGMTFCPGKKQPDGLAGNWARDLGLDLDRIRNWGARVVVTLMEAHELDRYAVAQIGAEVAARGMAWLHLPIVDVSIPDAAFEARWEQEAGATLHAHLAAGERVLLHCRGGLGRTGTIAARLLIEAGVPHEAAIQAVRRARRGTIEVARQEAYVRALQGT